MPGNACGAGCTFRDAVSGAYTARCSGKPDVEVPVKKFLGIFALLGSLVGAVMFWRKQQDDDEFLDEELE